MGVFGLWDILLTTAEKMSIEKLSGKILAIDASIWLVKADSIFGEDSQKIKCILQKIIYLRKNNILPVFVFDGIPPAIKRKTLQKRRQKMRQGSQIDIRKRTEIQVMHLLENVGKQKSEKQSSKQKKMLQKEQQMNQIDKILENLSQVEAKKSQVVSDDDILKIRLQSQVLSYKYQLLIQDPRLEGLERMQLQQFEELGIQEKQQYLEIVQNELHSIQSKKNRILTKKELQKLTPEQQLLYDMEKIEKKTKLRALQDELYRKTVAQNVKVEDGFQIIQEIRNGKKIVMKRKINTESQQSKNKWLGRGNKKQKNDFSVIFGYSKGQCNQQKSFNNDEPDVYIHEPDPFLMDLIGSDYTKNRQSNSQSKNISIHPKTKNNNWRISQHQMKQKVQDQSIKKFVDEPKQKAKKGNELAKKGQINSKKQQISMVSAFPQTQDILQHEESSDQQQFLGNSLTSMKIKNKSQEQQGKSYKQQKLQDKQFSVNQHQNPDNLPQFINYQNLSIRQLDSQDHKNLEFQKLLDMIGVPYIKAVSQAESQCAKLQMEGIVDGVVTEDSDVFLFGAKNVFRGVFNDNIKYFSANKIMEKLKLNREKLIIFAMMLGSDYTEGIKGIGIVNAMEILKIFDNFDKLDRFKQWARYADILHTQEKNTTQSIIKKLQNQEEKQFYEFHKRFKNYWYIDDDFPKLSVINAYLNPQVIDAVRTREMKQTKYFELKQFIEEPVRIFMRQRILLTYSQTDAYCRYLKRPFKREQQQLLTNYFVGDEHQFAKIRSKRLLKALGQYSQQENKKKAEEKQTQNTLRKN